MQEETPMSREKRERLEAAGWKVAGVAEFLGLSEDERVRVGEAAELAKQPIELDS